jgi:hypothetical protein
MSSVFLGCGLSDFDEIGTMVLGFLSSFIPRAGLLSSGQTI